MNVPGAVARILLLLLASAAVAAGPRNGFDLRYYKITGGSVQELRNELNRNGPVSEKGVRADGLTNWKISWEYDYENRNGTCRLTRVEVGLEVEMILPHWVAPRDAPADLIAQWDRYSTALRIHEDGHRWIAMEAAEEVRRRLRALGPGTDCQELERRTDTTGHAAVAEYSRRQDDYDRQTQLGRTQGARLP